MTVFWHALVIRLATLLGHRRAAVSIAGLRAGLELHYHGLGGVLSRRVVGDSRSAWVDAEQVHLPARIDRYPSPAQNRELYFWQAAFLALDRPLEGEAKWPAGVRHLLRGVATSARVLERFPALAPRYRRLCAAELEQRARALPGWDRPSRQAARALEAAIRRALAGGVVSHDEFRKADHSPFLPVPLWGHKSTRLLRWSPFKRSRRRRAEGRERPLGRPRFEPEHQPALVPGRPARGESLYPEWQGREYRAGWCAVSERAPEGASGARFDAASAARAAQVRRRFEALRQRTGWQGRRESGDELDLDACVESASDARGCGRPSERIYRARAPRRQSLSVAVLLDSSRSTESWVGEHRVIEIARESMLALAEALDAAGDDFGLYAFSSDSRLRVRCERVKGFDEPHGEAARQRIRSLRPENYTRMGAAIRHAGAHLVRRPAEQKLLLVLTDGRPHDPTDGYVGGYAIEDTRRALLELRAGGVHCHGLAIDRRGCDYLPRLFGAGHYGVLCDPRSLPQALPRLYERMTGTA